MSNLRIASSPRGREDGQSQCQGPTLGTSSRKDRAGSPSKGCIPSLPCESGGKAVRQWIKPLKAPEVTPVSNSSTPVNCP